MNRHDLIYLQASDSYRFLDTSLPLQVKQKIQEQISQNIPFTVCRQESEDYFKVAINIMLQQRKYRVALGLSATPTLSQRPLLLARILDRFSAEIQTMLQHFISAMQQLSCCVYVYGSYANQFFNPDIFVHAQSDLDLLIQPEHRHALDQIIAEIIKFKAQLCIPIDGEIALEHKQNISFNELIFALHHQQEQIIVKGLRDIKLQSIADICGGNLNVFQQ